MMLSERLAGLRRERGWTLRDLQAAILETSGARVAFSYLSSLERDDDRSPTVVTLHRIAVAYGIDVVRLLWPVDLSSHAIGHRQPEREEAA